MKRTVTFLAAAALGVVAADASAVKFGDPAAGEQKAQACAACHAVNGSNSNPAFPKIAGQYADYLLHALKAYKSGERQNAVMQGQVANLSVTDMEDLAAYFSTLDSDLRAVQPD